MQYKMYKYRKEHVKNLNLNAILVSWILVAQDRIDRIDFNEKDKKKRLRTYIAM